MHVSLLVQPFADMPSLASFIREIVEDEEVEQIDIVVAWAKRSGFNQIQESLEKFSKRDGLLRVVAGISQGGATRQGLQLMATLADEAYVFHNPGRTFHPKLYAGYGVSRARFVVGSQNLTRGGVVHNYELGVQIDADAVSGDEDVAFIGSVRAYVDKLVSDTELCLRLHADTLAELVRDPRYGVTDEDHPQNNMKVEPVDATGSGEDASGADQTGPLLFGKSLFKLRSSATTAGVNRMMEVTVPAGRLGFASATPTTPPVVLRRWLKKLPQSNVSRLAGNNHPQGHLTLTKSGHPIKQGTYFRDVFFADASWQQVVGMPGREKAIIHVHVIARDVDLGIFPLQVDHNPAFGSGQGNRATMLHWGPQLSRYLRQDVDHTDDIASLEKLSDGTYRLTLGDAPTGPFL